MDKKLFRLPILTLVGGIVHRIIQLITVLLIARGTNEWTIGMGNILFFIDLVISIIIFGIIGIILSKTTDRKTIFKSANLLVVYSIIILVVEQVTQHYGVYKVGISLWLFLPVGIFTIITQILAKISVSENINLVYVIPSLFAPYLFLIFGKKSRHLN